MADITNDALEAWFNEKYTGNTASREDSAAYESAQDKNEFKARMIAEERSKRENENQNQNDTRRPETNFTSDEWQQLISGENTDFFNSEAPIRVGIDRVILAQMNKLPENFASLGADAQQDAITLAKANLNADERDDFNQRDQALKREILEYYPPRRLVDTSRWLEEAENHASTDAIKAEMQASRAALMEIMVSKVNKYANGETIVDQTNIADVYDGARLMYDYVEEKNPNNDALKQHIETCRGKLEEQINIYDEANGFTGLTNDDAYEINETYLRAQKQAENKDKIKNPPEDLAHVWDNIEFEDDTKRQEFIDSFNEAVIKKATMNAAVKNKGKKGEELDTAIQAEIDLVYAAELTATLTANEAAKHLAQEEQKRQANPSYVPQPMSEQEAKAAGQAAYDAVINGTGGKYKVDNKVQVANFARYTNDAFGYLNRLGTKIGKKTNAVGNMAKSVKDFDKTCIKRFDPYYTIARTQSKAVLGNMGRQALNQLVRYGSSLVPGGNILYGAYVGGQAIWRLGSKYSRLKEEAKKNNRKLTLREFLKDHVGEIATFALATGAALLGGAAAKDAAKGLGFVGMAVGNLTNVIKTFKQQREKGESWWKSASVAAFSATLSTGSALGTSYALGLGMQLSGLGTTSHDSVVTDRSEFDRLRALPEEELTKQGYTLEYCDKTDEGAFLVQEGKDGYTSRDYTQEELDFAKHRMEQVLDPNDSHTGGTRYSEYLGHDWTDKSYNENTSAYKDAVASLDKLVETHPDMRSDINGQEVPNSDMLLYKLYQANILAPNTNALADNGQPIGEVLSYTDENGNTTTYQDTYHKLLNGEPLTEADAKVLQIVEDHVGGQHEGDVNDMGKIKDFDNLGDGKNPDSYNKDADVGYEPHDHLGQEELYQRMTQHTEEGVDILPFTMVHDNQGENRALAERVGANAKKAEKQDKTPVDKTPIDKTPVDKTPEEAEEILKRIKKKKEYQAPTTTVERPGYGKLLADEYKIMYGVDPKVVDNPKNPSEHRQYQHWINYNNRVEAERQATGRDIDMYGFLEERRQKFDEAIAKAGPLKIGGKETLQSEIAADYEKHKDNPGQAAVVNEARQSLWQSNITSHNYRDVMTLSHFTDYAGEFVRSTSFVADGTRDVSQNSQASMKKSGKEVLVADLNDFYFSHPDISYDDKRAAIEKVPAADAVTKMVEIAKRHPKNGPVIAKENGR